MRVLNIAGYPVTLTDKFNDSIKYTIPFDNRVYDIPDYYSEDNFNGMFRIILRPVEFDVKAFKDMINKHTQFTTEPPKVPEKPLMNVKIKPEIRLEQISKRSIDAIKKRKNTKSVITKTPIKLNLTESQQAIMMIEDEKKEVKTRKELDKMLRENKKVIDQDNKHVSKKNFKEDIPIIREFDETMMDVVDEGTSYEGDN